MHISPVKVMGVNLPDNVSDSLANHNTPAQTNQSELTACFWGSGFIESGSRPLVQGTEESVAYNKGEVYKKEKPRLYVILHPINRIMQRKKNSQPPSPL